MTRRWWRSTNPTAPRTPPHGRPSAKPRPCGRRSGDADACVFPIGNSLVYSFTAGRTQVRLTPYGQWTSKAPEEFIGKFTPVAQKVADEVRKAIG